MFYSRDNGKIVFLCSGSAALSSDDTTLIVDNLSTAVFNVYNLPHKQPFTLSLIGSDAKVHETMHFRGWRQNHSLWK